jgi:hypothetical protein
MNGKSNNTRNRPRNSGEILAQMDEVNERTLDRKI